MADNSSPMGTDLQGAKDAILTLMEAPERGNAESSEAIVEPAEELAAESDVAEYGEYEAEDLGATDDAEYSDEQFDDEPQHDRTFNVKVNGQNIEVTEEELLSGYSRQADYTRKSQELSEHRKLFEQERSELANERQQYAALLPQLERQLNEAVANEPDWDALYEQDPIQATKLERQWRTAKEQKAEQIQAVNAEQHRLATAERQQYESATQAMVQSEVTRLPELIPAWRNPQVAAKEATALRGFLLESGFPESDVENIKSAAVIAMARDAMLYRRGKTAVTKKVIKGRGQPKSMRAGSRGTQVKKSDVQKAHSRLRQTGKVGDAAALILSSGLAGE